MPASEHLGGVVLMTLSTLVVFAVAAVALLTRAGPQRPGLVAGVVPGALVVPATITVYVAFQQIRAFSALATAGTGTGRLMETSSSLWLLLRYGWGSAAVLALLSLLVAMLPSEGRGRPCSTRRGVVLLLLPVLGLLTAGLHLQQYAQGLRVSAAMVLMDESDPESQRRSDAILESVGLATEGSRGIAAVSTFIAGSMFAGAGGGFVAVIILAGLAATGFVLSWRVTVEGPFETGALVLWTVTVVATGLVALGVFNPLRVPPV